MPNQPSFSLQFYSGHQFMAKSITVFSYLKAEPLIKEAM